MPKIDIKPVPVTKNNLLKLKEMESQKTELAKQVKELTDNIDILHRAMCLTLEADGVDGVIECDAYRAELTARVYGSASGKFACEFLYDDEVEAAAVYEKIAEYYKETKEPTPRVKSKIKK